MYIAEIHGKLSRENENKEDILTSNVFSFFKYTNRDIFLKEFLSSIGIYASQDQLKEASFEFWVKYVDGTEPDLIIIVGGYYLLVEAKYFSDFGKENDKTEAQLVRELKGGYFEAKNMGLEFRIVTVTADYYKKMEKYSVIPEEFKDIVIWTSWQKICRLIAGILESSIEMDAGNWLFAQDLYSLLLKKNLIEFSGAKRLKGSKAIFNFKKQLFFDSDSASYRGDFSGFINVLRVDKQISLPKSTLFFLKGKNRLFAFNESFIELKPLGTRNIFFGIGGYEDGQ
jgi:hypothetical protein